MIQAKKNLWATLGVVSAAALVVAGSAVRTRVDLGGAKPELPAANLLVSRDQAVVPEGDYFHEMARLLKREYVEPIKDERKLAIGAVRGMVGSLGDLNSLYYDPAEFADYLDRRRGIYRGIGVELAYKLPPGVDANPKEPDAEEALATGSPRIPRLEVVAVIPGGGAQEAGVAIGDVVESIDGRWVLSADLVARFRQASRDLMAKKIDRATFNKIRSEVRAKAEHNLTPHKAMERLLLGEGSTLDVAWRRGGALRTTKIATRKVEVPPFKASGDTVKFLFTQGAADRLKAAIAGKKAVTIDLTQNVVGDFGAMRDCLEVVAPAGKYGRLVTAKGGTGTLLAVTKGNPKPPKLTLKVDASTRGAAEIFALALSSRGKAVLAGQKTGGDRVVRQSIQLPDGSGYTLATSEYRADMPVAKPAATKVSK